MIDVPGNKYSRDQLRQKERRCIQRTQVICRLPSKQNLYIWQKSLENFVVALRLSRKLKFHLVIICHFWSIPKPDLTGWKKEILCLSGISAQNFFTPNFALPI